MSRTRLPETAREVFRLGPLERVLYDGVIALARLTGHWRYPIDASGDLETMTTRDLIYWVYKSAYPTTRARKGSGLEAYFDGQSSFRWALPAGFEPASEMTISCVGDLMDHPFLPRSAQTLYADVAELVFGADISTANLECVIYPKGAGDLVISPKSGPPLFYKPGSFEAVKGHRESKYTFVCTACNHTLDFGADGVASTVRALRAEGIAFSGVNESEADSRAMTIIERNGIRVGMVAHTFGLNARPPSPDKPWLVNRSHVNGKVADLEVARFASQLQFGRDRGIDLAVVQLHWGLEHELYPTPNQLEVAHHLAEMGFDVIVGHHSHVVQPVEYYRTRRDPDRVVPIFYSLGNLITPFSAALFRRSYVARVDVAKGVDGHGVSRTYIRDAGVSAVVLEVDEQTETLRLRRESGSHEAGG